MKGAQPAAAQLAVGIIFLAVAAALVVQPALGQGCGRLPNIILILADDLGSGDLSSYNPASKVQTPHIDRLASQGLRFTDAHSSSSVCTPSRYSILTGRYAWRSSLTSGVLHSNSPPLIPPNRMTLASLLKAKGYHSACIGKWHLGLGWANTGDWSRGYSGGPTSLGFEYFYGIPASLDMADYAYLEYDSPVKAPTQPIAASPLPAMWRAGLVAPDFRHIEVLPNITRKAVDYLSQRAATSPQKPFFLYLPLTSPHTPLIMPDSIDGMRIRGASQGGVRCDFVRMTDWAVGKVLRALDSLGISDNTLVFFAGDNGAMDYDSRQNGHAPHLNYRGQKADIFEAGHRVPLIVRWPGVVAQNRVSRETVCFTDFMATFAAVTSSRLPDDAGEDSYSWLPILLGRTLSAPLREATVHHADNGLFAIRRGRWKLTPDDLGSGGFTAPVTQAGPGTLYNLETDVSETSNQYANRPNDVAQMRALLNQYRAGTRSTPVPRNDEFWTCPVGNGPTAKNRVRADFRTEIRGATLVVEIGRRTILSLELLNQAGQVVTLRKNLVGQAECAMGLGGLPPGIYTLRVRESSVVHVQKFVLPSER